MFLSKEGSSIMNRPSNLPPAVVIALPLMLCIQVLLWVVFLPTSLRGRVDFRAFYAAAHMARNGEAALIYDYEREQAVQSSLTEDQGMLPYIHPPYEVLLFVPFSFLKIRAATVAFMVFNLSLLGAAISLLQRQGMGPGRLRMTALLSAAFVPFSVTLLQGQDMIVMLLLLVVSYKLLREERDLAAGMATGICLFRFQIALPILLLFLLWKRWRFAAGFALSAIGVLALSLAMVGPAGCARYAQELVSASLSAANQPSYVPSFTPEFMPNLRGLVTALIGSHVSAKAMYGILIALSAPLLWWAARQNPQKQHALLLAIPVSLIVAYHSHVHDLSILAIPLFPALLRSAKSAVSAAAAFVTPSFALLFPSALCLVTVPLIAFTFSLRNPSALRGVE